MLQVALFSVKRMIGSYDPTGIVQGSVASGHPVVYVSANYRAGSMSLHQYMTRVCC